MLSVTTVFFVVFPGLVHFYLLLVILFISRSLKNFRSVSKRSYLLKTYLSFTFCFVFQPRIIMSPPPGRGSWSICLSFDLNTRQFCIPTVNFVQRLLILPLLSHAAFALAKAADVTDVISPTKSLTTVQNVWTHPIIVEKLTFNF